LTGGDRKLKELVEENLELKRRLGLLVRLQISKGVITAQEYAALITDAQPGSYTHSRAELAIRFGVILRKVWGGNRTWAGARAQPVLMAVLRTCWQQWRSVLDLLSPLLRCTPAALTLPP
jgi:transposase